MGHGPPARVRLPGGSHRAVLDPALTTARHQGPAAGVSAGVSARVLPGALGRSELVNGDADAR